MPCLHAQPVICCERILLLLYCTDFSHSFFFFAFGFLLWLFLFSITYCRLSVFYFASLLLYVQWCFLLDCQCHAHVSAIVTFILWFLNECFLGHQHVCWKQLHLHHVGSFPFIDHVRHDSIKIKPDWIKSNQREKTQICFTTSLGNKATKHLIMLIFRKTNPY